MCDYSAESAKRRDARQGDKLVSNTISTMGHTRGFTAAEDPSMAVCLIPGTGLRFAKHVVIDERRFHGANATNMIIPFTEAKFIQVEPGKATFHDALEFPNGKSYMLNALVIGQEAEVLQLPASAEHHHHDHDHAPQLEEPRQLELV